MLCLQQGLNLILSFLRFDVARAAKQKTIVTSVHMLQLVRQVTSIQIRYNSVQMERFLSATNHALVFSVANEKLAVGLRPCDGRLE